MQNEICLLLGVLIRLPKAFHELQPVLGASAPNLGGATRENGKTEVATGTTENQLNFVGYIFRNRGVLFEALQQLEHIRRSGNQVGAGVGFHFGLDGGNWLTASVHYPRKL